MKVRAALLLLLILSLVSLSDVIAQSGAAKGKGRVRGTVTDAEGNPMIDVTVRFVSERLETSFETKTNEKGSFTVTGMAGGSWNVDFLKEGFRERKISIQVSELGYNKPMDLSLEKLQLVQQAPEREKVPGVDLVEEGNNLRAQKDYAGAIAKYEAAVAMNPTLTGVMGDIARAYNEMGQPDKAIEAFEKLLAADATNQDARLEMASLMLQKGRIDDAKKVLGVADLSTITNPYTLYNLGVGFYNAQQAEEAIKYWEKAVVLDEKLSDGWLQLGFAYYSVKNIAKAREALQKVIDLEPGSESAKSAQEFLDSIK